MCEAGIATGLDIWHTFADGEVLAHNTQILEQHCVEVGRDRAQIEHSAFVGADRGTLVIAVLRAAVTAGEEFASLPSQSDQLAGLAATLIVPPPSLASTTCAALACVGLDHQKWVKKPVPEPAPDVAK
jgi:hypothetical protein